MLQPFGQFQEQTSRFAHVAARTGVPNVISGSNTQAGFRSWNYNFVPVTSLRIWFANFYVSSATSGVETSTGSDMTVRCAVEYPRGTWTEVQSVTIAAGGRGYVDIPVTIPAFARYRICGDMNMTTGSGRVPSCNWSNIADRGGGDEYLVGASGYNQIANSTVLGSGGASAVLPLAVCAISSLREVTGLVGDSITAGVNDTFGDAAGGRGLYGRGANRAGPALNMGVPGDRAVWFTASNAAQRIAMMQEAGVTRAILALGVNDLNNGQTSANLLTERQRIRALLPGVRWLDATVTPTVTTTDNYATAANQAVASAGNNTQRTTFNDALRAGTALAQGSSGTIDVAAALETSTSNPVGPVLNGGVWLPGTIGFSDGTHPSSGGYERVSPIVERALNSL